MINQERPELKLVWLDHGHPGWRADHALEAVDKVLADKPRSIHTTSRKRCTTGFAVTDSFME